MHKDYSLTALSKLSDYLIYLKDLDSSIRSFWFLIVVLWRNASLAVSHYKITAALSRCWDMLQKHAHFDLTSTQPQCTSVHYAADNLSSLQQDWEDSW